MAQATVAGCSGPAPEPAESAATDSALRRGSKKEAGSGSAPDGAAVPHGAFAVDYFATMDLTGPVVARGNVPAIALDWGLGSPDPAVPSDHFSARFTGDFDFDGSAQSFVVENLDDGARLYVDGAKIGESWGKDQYQATFRADSTPAAGTHRVVLEYDEDAGSAAVTLRWAGQAQAQAPTAPATQPAGTVPYSIGIYGGISEAERLAGLMGGRKLDHLIGYVNRYGWDYYTSLDGAFGFNDDLANGFKVAVSVPTMLDQGYGTDMHSAATGAYDGYYAALAQALAPHASSIVAFTINWEFNGNWFSYGVVNDDGSLRWQPSDFIGAHRRLTSILRQHCPGVPIVWGLNNGPETHLPSGYKAEDYYPGDDWVDAIGLDLYEQNWHSFASAKADGGLDWIDAFSLAHGGKKLALPEWAADNDPDFITSMAAWMNDPARQQRMLMWTYWDSADAVGAAVNALSLDSAQQGAFVNAWKDTRLYVP